ncbi:uncharacterized protein TRAVEDRAFT_53617 [Trametes versicolor FP-101664 SS1]|uniref:uncharacterized protein n=1 Tax=Trametes versicolor (strain FP-101664) TaxID=717944 RepID=UPI0004622EA3|nr:uncharacterized protein TRAVEDRAFT_53617 [Trametes versicolor FP-101664 SS1]EIW52192.1 hypothetical protein TRAVEDRAFT_53617 [Trametes versicolor FP-101664 SS1]
MEGAPDPAADHNPGAVGLPLNDPVDTQAEAAEALAPGSVLESPTESNIKWSYPEGGFAPPQGLERILSKVGKQFKGVIYGFNQVIKAIRIYQSDRLHHLESPLLRPSHEAITYGEAVPVIVSSAPGHMLPKLRCRNSFEQHLEYFARRSEAMRDYEEWLEGAIRQAQPLFEKHSAFLKREAERSRQVWTHMAVRAAAIATLPFAPVLSAVLTAVDALGIAVYNGVEEVLSGSADYIQPLSADIDDLQKSLRQSVSQARETRRKLMETCKKAEWQRDDPCASRLITFQRKLRVVVDVANEVLVGEKSSAVVVQTRSLREVTNAIREVMNVIGDRPEGEFSLIDLEDFEWPEVDKAMAEIRALLLVQTS